MKKRIRIKDIAERAGVSPGTVDRVIHRRGNVAKPVEERVRQVMKELDYKPNRIASTLAFNRTYRVATLLPDYRADPYWDQPRLGVKRAFDAVQHYNIVWEPYYFDLYRPADFREQALRILREPPDALLLAPLFLAEGRWLLDECRKLDLPAVKINTNIEETHSLCYVGQDSYQSGVLAGKLLHFFLRPGQAVMVLNLDKESHSAQHLIDKEQGLRAYFAGQNGFPVDILQREFANFDDSAALRDFLCAQLAEPSHPRAVFVTNSRSYKLLDALGNDLPAGLRIVGFDLLEPNLRYLRENKIAFLINQNPVQQGYQGIVSIYTHLVLRQEVERKQYLPLDIVVTENVQYYLQRERELHLLV